MKENPLKIQDDERGRSAKLIREAMKYYNSGEETERLIQEILKTEKDTFDTLQMLGIKEGESGRFEEAEALIRQALKINRTSAVTSNNLGVILTKQIRPSEAIESYLRALELKSDFVEAHFNLGNAFREQGSLVEATKCFKRALELKPDYAEAYCGMGDALREGGNLSEAIETCRRAVELNPGFAEGYRSLGDALREGGNLSEAIDAYQRAVELNPDYDEAYRHLGVALREQAACINAKKNLSKDDGLKSDFVPDCKKLREALMEQGTLSEEIENCLKVVELKPDFAMAHNRLGSVLMEEGKLSEASDCYCRAIKLKGDYALAHSNYVTCRKFTMEDGIYGDRLEAFLAEAKTPEDRSNLHFALGKIYNDFGRYDDSFQHYSSFNRFERKKFTYHKEYFSSYVDRLIGTFPAGFYGVKPWTGTDADLPVFILGMPRSGTTLIEQIISSHPLVHGAGELDCLDGIVKKLKERYKTAYPECLKSISLDDLRDQADYYLDYLRDLSGDSLRITDKMPQNFRHLGFISLLFRSHRVIHCRRNPLDTCLSIFFQKFSVKGHPYAYDLGELGHYYLDYDRLMAHWRKVLPPEMMMEINYEDVVERPEEMCRKLIAFSGLEWDDRCLKFNENLRTVRTASFWQVRQPLYKTSKERWRKYEKHLGPLQRVLEQKRN